MFRPMQWALAALLACVATPGHAIDLGGRSEPLALEATELLRAARDLRPAEPAALYVLLDESHYRLDADGRIELRQRRIFRVETIDGVAAAGELSQQWNPWFEARPKIRARVVTPDGKETRIDDSTLIEGSAVDAQQAVFTNQRRLRGPLPGLMVGAIVEYEIVTTQTRPFFAAGTVYRVHLAGWAPRLTTRITIDAPATLPLRHRLNGLPALRTTESVRDDRRYVTLDTGPVPALEDLPPLLPAEALPDPSLEFSNGADWRSVASAYAAEVEPLLASTTRLAPPANRDAFIAEQLEALQKNVRYTGLDLNASGLFPARPDQTWSRRFGDCKDKSAWLVMRLREAGIQAYVALLAVGDRADVPADLPGMGLFDHAIVYVPGERELWIDVTAEFARVGTLPAGSRDRLALVIEPGVTALRRTPAATPDDNLLIEHREFTLSPRGASRVVERTVTHGDTELQYRSRYASPIDKATRESLEEYASSHYLSRKVTSITHSEPTRLDQPFELRIEMAEAGRGATDLFEAGVGVTLPTIHDRLPEALTQEPDEQDEPREHDFVFEPFATEWHYRITPPAGFSLRELSLPERRQLGPATLTQQLQQDSDGTVRLRFRFDSVKGRYSVAEAAALRRALGTLDAEPTLLVYFDHEANVRLRRGDARGAIALLEKSAAQEPKAAVHRARLALALLNLGLVERARREAQLAVKLEPRTAFYHALLGDTLSHDVFGRHLQPGFERDAAIAAYRRALQLDPTLADAHAALAVALEFSDSGERYGAGAALDRAVEEYRARRKQLSDPTDDDMAKNLPIALFFAGRYDELPAALDELPAASRETGLRYAALALAQGAPAAIEAIRASVHEPAARERALLETATRLAQRQRYDLGEAFVDSLSTTPAGANRDAVRMISRLYRSAAEEARNPPPANTPTAMVKRMLRVGFDESSPERELERLLSPGLRKNLPTESAGELLRLRSLIRNLRTDSFVPVDTAIDLALAALTFREETVAGVASRVTLVTPSGDVRFYVAQEGDAPAIVAIDSAHIEFAARAEAHLARGDLAGARQWLDWAAEQLPTSVSDNLWSGSLYARFWRAGRVAELPAMRLAAAALRLEGQDASLDPALFGADASDAVRDPLALPLARVRLAQWQRRWADALREIAPVHEAHPESRSTLMAIATFAALADDAGAFERAVARSTVNAATVLDARVQYLSARQELDAAAALLRPLIEAKTATAQQANTFAWLSAGLPAADPLALDAIRAATQNTNSRAMRHTLGCMQALGGHTQESRETLLSLMKQRLHSEPDDAEWFLQALIAESIGDRESARLYHSRAIAAATDQTPGAVTATAEFAKLRLERLR